MNELTYRRKMLILAICCMSLLIVGMDATIVNVALPAIKHDLHASVSGLQWTIDAYTLVLASLLILSGSTGDRLGRRRTFQTGLVLFTVGSLLCSLAPGLGWLIAFRMVQAVGGSMLNPVAMSIVTNVFTDPRERARAIGMWGGVVGVSMGIGPVLGGALISWIDWRAIFWVNVPIGVAAIVLAALFVPESKAPRARRIDPIGQMLVIVVLACTTYAIIEAPRAGFSFEIVGFASAAFLALAALLWYEPRRADPLIELRFFRSLTFSGATVIAVCAFGSYAGFLFLNTLYLQDVLGYSALKAGTCMLPMAVVTMICAPLSGRVVGARGPRPSLLVAGAFMVAGALLITRIQINSPLLLVLLSYSIFAVGFGTVNAPITNSAVSGMPREQAGVAAAIASTSRQVGATLGVAVVGAVVAVRGGSSGVALHAASRPAWWVVVGSSLAVLILGWLTSGRRARASAARVSLAPVAELTD